MRAVSFVLLMSFLVAVGIFAVQNQQIVTLEYLDRTISVPIAFLIGAVYLLGMLSGWTVLGAFRRSLEHVSKPPRD